ncbi:FBD-like protein, partial [Cynara cardunculus var. scolymus]
MGKYWELFLLRVVFFSNEENETVTCPRSKALNLTVSLLMFVEGELEVSNRVAVLLNPARRPHERLVPATVEEESTWYTMRKRMRLTQNMDNHHDFNSDDFLSRLPDSILVSILSGLPLKDAAATSQLSRRWRYLWCQTVRLDIDNDKRLDYIAAPSKLRLIGRNKYINWVNRVIRQHRSLTIEHFRIHYDLDMDSKGAITKWIEFAISRNVQNLVLDLTETSDYRSNPARNFVFPNNILDRKSRTSSLKQQSYFNVPGVPSTEVMEIKFLKALTLKGVNIGDETMSKILMSCRALEYLSIYNSGDMVKFKISGKELKLTTLEIVLCPGLLSIDISNSNLACFTYLGPVVRIKLNELPRLEKISIGGLGTTWIDNNLFQRISSFFHLQVLELNFPRPKEDMHLVPLPEMPNVKQLIVMADAWEDESLLGFTWVVRACPNLQRFVIELSWMPTMKRRIRKRSVVKHLHQHLERVEIGGYYGRMSDLELALYFIENGIALKKMVIDPHDQGFKRTPIRETLVKRAARSSETLKVKTARFRARHWLVPKMPPGVELSLSIFSLHFRLQDEEEDAAGTKHVNADIFRVFIKGDRHDLNSNDFLSRLPDEVLVSILSSLPIKDAAVTSQLSRRWRYLWCQAVRLDFEDNRRLDNNIVAKPKLRLLERNKYINRVNRVLRQHRSAMIEEFKICFDLDKYCKGAISKWIEFALSKNVQKLELDLIDKSQMRSDPVLNFVFPNKILDRISRSSLKRHSYSSVPRMPYAKVMEIKFLKVLILKCVNINDEAISKILVSCRLLEHLTIHESEQLVNVKICGQQFKLINLQITYCPLLESVEICDSNLAYFCYYGLAINLKLNKVPELKKISIGEGSTWNENTLFQQISSCRLYLQVLELTIYYPKQNMHVLSLPELPCVKQLILSVGAWEDSTLLEFTWLARACPNLHKFVIQMMWMATIKRTNRLMNMVKHPHQHLEVVEIGGYYGRNSDLELALYFIENGIALKKMVIDTYEYHLTSRTPIATETLEVTAARFLAHVQLASIMRHGLEL